jgi:hypothetical protein
MVEALLIVSKKDDFKDCGVARVARCGRRYQANQATKRAYEAPLDALGRTGRRENKPALIVDKPLTQTSFISSQGHSALFLSFGLCGLWLDSESATTCALLLFPLSLLPFAHSLTHTLTHSMKD